MNELLASHEIQLDRPPVVHQIAIATHGHAPIERWRDLSFWSMHAYRYSAAVRVGDAWHDIAPGMVSVFRPNVELEYRYRGPSTHTYVHFDVLHRPGAAGTHLPVVIHLGAMFEQFDRDFAESAQWMQTQPHRATARIWDLLWRLSNVEAGRTRPVSGHRLLDRAIEWIELHLADPIAIADLAAALDVSHAHLARLFHEYLNVAPLAYVHGRRVDRAVHLLRHTTLPMKSIARQIGLVDLQQLNKLVRRVSGCSPTRIRNGQ